VATIVVWCGDATPLEHISAVIAQPTGVGGAQISFTLSAPATVSARILNVAGREVATIYRRGELDSGLQSLVWNGQDAGGLVVPNGTYLVQLTAKTSDGMSTRQMATLNLRR